VRVRDRGRGQQGEDPQALRRVPHAVREAQELAPGRAVPAAWGDAGEAGTDRPTPQRH